MGQVIQNLFKVIMNSFTCVFDEFIEIIGLFLELSIAGERRHHCQYKVDEPFGVQHL